MHIAKNTKWAPVSVTILEQSLKVKLLSCYFSFNIEHFLWDCGCEAAISFISRIFSYFISFNSVRKIVQARHVAEGVTVKGYYPVRCCAVPIFLVQPPYTTSGWVQSLDTWWLTWRNMWHVSTAPLNTGWHDVTSPHVTRVNILIISI